MKSAWCLASAAIGTVLVLGSGNRASAYYPPECFPDYAKDDFKKSALVVIGRVTAVERFRVSPTLAPKERANWGTEFFYLATVTVGRTLKGKTNPGDDILLYTGYYPQRKEDETQAVSIRVANDHPAWTLDYGHVYLLALDLQSSQVDARGIAEAHRDGKWVHAALENREIWAPRSCHFSIHEITVLNREEVVDAGETLRLTPETYLQPYFNRWRAPIKKGEWILLDKFIAAQEKGEFPRPEAQDTKSAPSPKKPDPPKARK
jgi:hypothetical protein